MVLGPIGLQQVRFLLALAQSLLSCQHDKRTLTGRAGSILAFILTVHVFQEAKAVNPGLFQPNADCQTETNPCPDSRP